MYFIVDSASRPKIGNFALRPVFGSENHQFCYHFGSRNQKKRCPGGYQKIGRFSVSFFSGKRRQKIDPVRQTLQRLVPGHTHQPGMAECGRPQSYAPPGIGPEKGLSPGWIYETPGTPVGYGEFKRSAHSAVPNLDAKIHGGLVEWMHWKC